MIIKALYKSPNLSKHYKQGKSYKLDFNIVSRTFGSTKDCIKIEKTNDYYEVTTKKYSSLKEFLKHWLIT